MVGWRKTPSEIVFVPFKIDTVWLCLRAWTELMYSRGQLNVATVATFKAQNIATVAAFNT